MARKVGNSTMREHYAAMAKASGKTVTEPALPTALRYLWNVFAMLHRGRGSNGFGPNPISWQDIWCYCAMTGTKLAQWEVEAITMLDDAFLISSAQQAESQ